jgi:hypothetical protein
MNDFAYQQCHAARLYEVLERSHLHGVALFHGIGRIDLTLLRACNPPVTADNPFLSSFQLAYH